MLLRGKKIVTDQMIKNMVSNDRFQNLTNNRSQCNWTIIVWTTTATPLNELTHISYNVVICVYENIIAYTILAG